MLNYLPEPLFLPLGCAFSYNRAYLINGRLRKTDMHTEQMTLKVDRSVRPVEETENTLAFLLSNHQG